MGMVLHEHQVLLWADFNAEESLVWLNSKYMYMVSRGKQEA